VGNPWSYHLARIFAPELYDNFAAIVDENGMVGVSLGDGYVNYPPEDARKMAEALNNAASYCETINSNVLSFNKFLRDKFDKRDGPSLPLSSYEKDQEKRGDNIPTARRPEDV